MEDFAWICFLSALIGLGWGVGAATSTHDMKINEIQAAQDACSKDEGLFMIKSQNPKSTALCKNGSKFQLKGDF